MNSEAKHLKLVPACTREGKMLWRLLIFRPCRPGRIMWMDAIVKDISFVQLVTVTWLLLLMHIKLKSAQILVCSLSRSPSHIVVVFPVRNKREWNFRWQIHRVLWRRSRSRVCISSFLWWLWAETDELPGRSSARLQSSPHPAAGHMAFVHCAHLLLAVLPCRMSQNSDFIHSVDSLVNSLYNLHQCERVSLGSTPHSRALMILNAFVFKKKKCLLPNNYKCHYTQMCTKATDAALQLVARQPCITVPRAAAN